jgi:hypothetical protein
MHIYALRSYLLTDCRVTEASTNFGSNETQYLLSLHMNFHPQNNIKHQFLVHNIEKKLNRSNLKMMLTLLLFLFNFGGCQYFELCNTDVDSVPEIPVQK